MKTLPWLVFLPALILSSSAATESWGFPDFHEVDKVEHLEGGAIIGALATAVAQREMPKATWWQQALVGVAASAVIGVAKEAIDAHANGHDSDPKDAIATVLGGVAGSVSISLVWHL